MPVKDVPSTRPRLDKLGVKEGARVVLLGVEDPDFLKELAERTPDVHIGRTAKDADLIFFGATRRAQLARLAKLEGLIKRNGAIWVVRPKGAGAVDITEMDVMGAGKAARLVDNKVVAFSATHSALRFVIPLARR